MTIYVIFYASTYGDELYTESVVHTDKEKAEKAFREYRANTVADEFDDMSDDEITAYVDAHTTKYNEHMTIFHMNAVNYEVEITLKKIER